MRIVYRVTVDFGDIEREASEDAISAMLGWVESNYDCTTDHDIILEGEDE